MKTTIYIYLVNLLAFILSTSFVYGQNTMQQPVDLGTKAYSFSYTDTKNTTEFTNNYVGRTTNDVFYKFTLTCTMDVIISHCGSAISDTYLHLLNKDSTRIAYNDDYSGVGKCSNSLHSYIKTSLTPGIYYVVSEGYSANGSITTSIEGNAPLPATGLYDGNSASSGENYILTISPTVETSNVSSLGVDQSIQTVQYFDGLGRPVETVQRGATPQKADLVTYTEYDGTGKNNIQWLPTPFANNKGAFVNKTSFEPQAKSQYNDARPFSETIFESYPLDRVEKQFGAGAAWNNNPTSMQYGTNGNNILYFYVNSSGTLQKDTNNYVAGTLYKTTVRDEDNKPTVEYKDKLGQVILKQSFDGTTEVNTYYVYNDLGQLSYVIPPKAVDELTTDLSDDNPIIKQLCYMYKYNERGNCKIKRLPGCKPNYMVYDKANRLILSQDGNQRQQNKWVVTKYDALGRVIYTGVKTIEASDTIYPTDLAADLSDEVIVETVASGTGFMNTGYTCVKYAPETLLTVNYYDDYSFIGTQTALSFVTKDDFGNYNASAKGLLTGTRTYILDGSGLYTTDALYYDYRGRCIQTRNTNHLGGTDITYSRYNFSGLVTKSLKEHTIAGQTTPMKELYTYSYDHAGRVLKILYKINETEIILTDLTETGAYDEFGRLRKKKRHNGTDAEEFDYNIRNWATRIKSGTFQEQLYYNSLPPGATAAACFNGNIAYTVFGNTNSMPLRSYAYTYDNLNRLKSGVGYYFTYSQSSSSGNNETFDYDKMGNITSMMRYKDNSVIDYLSFKHNGNQTTGVFDYAGTKNSYSIKEYQDKNHVYGATNEMKYDANGNMTKDLDRDIVTIKYNLLNLPEIVQFKNGNQIKNTYDASGSKLKAEYYTLINSLSVPLAEDQLIDAANLMANYSCVLTGTCYLGNIEYSFSNDQGDYQFDLNMVYNNEGYSTNLLAPVYFYYRKDHLGNNREVWCANNNTTAQRTQYYPSGLPWAINTSDHPEAQNKKYNGKEFIEMHGLDEYDSEARWYYPAIMRTTTIDPLAEKYYSISPYTWCHNNPVNAIDPDGMADYWAKDGTYLGNDGVDDKLLYAVNNGTYRTDKNGKSYIPENQLTLIEGVSINEFLDIAGIANGETSGDTKETFAFANAIVNNMKDGKSETEATSGNFSYAKSNRTEEYKDIVDSDLKSLNGKKGQIAIAGTINALIGGYDYSNGAKGWDGTDVLQGSPNSKSPTGHNSPNNHYRQINGGISDPSNLAPIFYKNTQNYIAEKFGFGGKEFRAIKPLILNRTVSGKSQYIIKATYGASVFYDHR